MAFFDTTWYVNYGNGSSTGYYAVAQFATATTYTVGQLIRQLTTPAVGNERVFVCIVAGLSVSEPSWTVTRGAKNTSTTPVFQECTGAAGVNGDLTNCPTWTSVKQKAVTLGQVIQNVAGTYLFICSTAGTGTDTSEPSWTLTAGVTTADGTVTWTCIGAVGNFGAWAAPHARLSNAFAANWGTAGNFFYVKSTHAETYGGNVTRFTGPGTTTSPCYIICVDSATLPPASGDITTGASITSTYTSTSGLQPEYAAANNTQNYYNGVAFVSTGTWGQIIVAPSTGGNCYFKFENCSFEPTGGSALLLFGNQAQGNTYELVNTNVVTGTSGFAAGAIKLTDTFIWRNTTSAISGSTTNINALFSSASEIPVDALIEGVDLSLSYIAGLIGTSSLAATFANSYMCLKDCKLSSGVVGFLAGSAASASSILDIVNCDGGATNYRSERHTQQGDQTTATTVYRSGGFAIEGTPLSWQIVTPSSTAVPSWAVPFKAQALVIRNGATGSSIGVTLYGIVNAAAVPNNDQFWFDVEYMGSSASPLGSLATGAKANILAAGTALTADTSAWDGGATARANSTAYTLGKIIKVSSAAGQLFFCTTAGTSSSSLPGGYATCADGSSVTDGGATFRAGCRFSLTVSVTPEMAGLFTIYPKMAAAGTTLFLDPLPVL